MVLLTLNTIQIIQSTELKISVFPLTLLVIVTNIDTFKGVYDYNIAAATAPVRLTLNDASHYRTIGL